MKQYIIANNRIRARKVRLIDEKGIQLGVFDLSEALKKAQSKGLDLIQVTDKAEPPVCKIMEYGKYAYSVSKKERKNKPQKVGELKNIRLTFNISVHDLETRAIAADKFLRKGAKIRVDMRLRGREKALGAHASEKMKQFFDILNAKTPIKVERELKREPRGFTMLIAKK